MPATLVQRWIRAGAAHLVFAVSHHLVVLAATVMYDLTASQTNRILDTRQRTPHVGNRFEGVGDGVE